MSAITGAYLDAAASAAALLADPAVAATWDQPSALKEFSVRGLAGHLGSQVLYVSQALEAEAPDEEPLSVVEFYDKVGAFHVDENAEINVFIRQEGETAASNGAKALADDVEEALVKQRATLSTVRDDRIVSFATKSLLFSDFLLIRLLEIAVHSDDLSVSVDITTPQLPPQVFDPVLDLLSRLAVVQHGQAAVLRTLSRAERAPATIAGI